MKEWVQKGSTTIEYKNEEYEVEVEGIFYNEMCGQDADGNRGVMLTFCDDFKIMTISPPPSSEEALHYIEESVYALMSDDFNWEDDGPTAPDHPND